MKKVLAFFGAFNPPTKAHVDLAKLAMEQTGHEAVIFVPSKSSYIIEEQKKEFAFSDEERLDMLHEIYRHVPWMDFCMRDLVLEEQPCTYDTLKYIRDVLHYNPTLLIGADQFNNMEKHWKYVPKIAEEFGIVVLTRSFFSLSCESNSSLFYKGIAPYVKIIQTPAYYGNISSTSARHALCEAKAYLKELKEKVPREVYDYLKEKYL